MNDRAAQRKAFKEELARLRAKEQAGTLTAAEVEALRRATTVRGRRFAAAGIAQAAEAARIKKATANGRPHPELPPRKPMGARGQAPPPRIARVVGGGAPGQGRRS